MRDATHAVKPPACASSRGKTEGASLGRKQLDGSGQPGHHAFFATKLSHSVQPLSLATLLPVLSSSLATVDRRAVAGRPPSSRRVCHAECSSSPRPPA